MPVQEQYAVKEATKKKIEDVDDIARNVTQAFYYKAKWAAENEEYPFYWTQKEINRAAEQTGREAEEEVRAWQVAHIIEVLENNRKE